MVKMKQNKRVLPININPYIRSYTWHAFIHAIAGNEYTIGKKIADFSFLGEEPEQMLCYGVETDGKRTKDRYEVFAKPYAYNARHCVYRACKEKDEIAVQINYQQYAGEWNKIMVFFGHGNETMESNNLKLQKAGIYSGKGFFSVINNEHRCGIIHKPDYLEPSWLKVTYDNGMISFYGAGKKEEWVLLGQIQESVDENEKLYLGVCVEQEEGKDYFNWVYSNYIQLAGAITYDTPVDFCAYPYRDSTYFSLNPCVIFQRSNFCLLQERGKNILDFIKEAIDCNRYIEFLLEEKYLTRYEANRYQYSRIHQNLVYGYDETKEELMILGVDSNGYPINGSVPKEEFLKAFYAGEYASGIYTLEYKPDDSNYRLNVKKIIQLLEDYLEGRNSSEDYGTLVNPMECVYGIKLYDEFVEKDGAERISKDYRIAFTFSEHKKIMKDRVEFLIERKIISKAEAEDVMIQLNQICLVSSTLLILVLKNQGKPVKNLKQRLIKNIEQVKKLEKECYSSLIVLLKSKL